MHAVVKIAQYLFHQNFRILPWDKNMFIYYKIKSHEILLPCQMLKRYMLRTFCNHFFIFRLLLQTDFFLRMCKKRSPVCLTDKLKKKPCIQGRFLNPRLF